MKAKRPLFALLLLSGLPVAHCNDMTGAGSGVVPDRPISINIDDYAQVSSVSQSGHSRKPVLTNASCQCNFPATGCCNEVFQSNSATKQWNFGGHTQVGYYTDSVPLSQSVDDLLSFHDVPDLVQLNQQWLFTERVASKNGDWGLGGRIDAIYGVDAQKMQAFGNPAAGTRNVGSFDASWDHGIYGWALPQLYGEIANDELSIKAGHFFTPVGYEVLPSTGNFFYTHSYAMFNSEPFTHTGVLATYKGIEGLTVYSGWALGWDTGFDQVNQGNLALGGFTSKLSDDISFTYISAYGNFGWRDGGDNNSYSHAIVVTAGLTDRLQYVGQSDLVCTSNPGISAYETVGLNQYLFLTLTEKAKLGTRIEWWKGDGISYNAVSSGVNYSAFKNFVVRPEYRHDWSPGIGLVNDVFAVDAILSY